MRDPGRASLGRRPGVHATQVAGLTQPRLRNPGCASLGLFLLLRLFFFFVLLALISFSAGAVVLLYMGFKSSL